MQAGVQKAIKEAKFYAAPKDGARKGEVLAKVLFMDPNNKERGRDNLPLVMDNKWVEHYLREYKKAYPDQKDPIERVKNMHYNQKGDGDQKVRVIREEGPGKIHVMHYNARSASEKGGSFATIKKNAENHYKEAFKNMLGAVEKDAKMVLVIPVAFLPQQGWSALQIQEYKQMILNELKVACKNAGVEPSNIIFCAANRMNVSPFLSGEDKDLDDIVKKLYEKGYKPVYAHTAPNHPDRFMQGAASKYPGPAREENDAREPGNVDMYLKMSPRFREALLTYLKEKRPSERKAIEILEKIQKEHPQDQVQQRGGIANAGAMGGGKLDVGFRKVDGQDQMRINFGGQNDANDPQAKEMAKLLKQKIKDKYLGFDPFVGGERHQNCLYLNDQKMASQYEKDIMSLANEARNEVMAIQNMRGNRLSPKAFENVAQVKVNEFRINDKIVASAQLSNYKNNNVKYVRLNFGTQTNNTPEDRKMAQELYNKLNQQNIGVKMLLGKENCVYIPEQYFEANKNKSIASLVQEVHIGNKAKGGQNDVKNDVKVVKDDNYVNVSKEENIAKILFKGNNGPAKAKHFVCEAQKINGLAGNCVVIPFEKPHFVYIPVATHEEFQKQLDEIIEGMKIDPKFKANQKENSPFPDNGTNGKPVGTLIQNMLVVGDIKKALKDVPVGKKDQADFVQVVANFAEENRGINPPDKEKFNKACNNKFNFEDAKKFADHYNNMHPKENKNPNPNPNHAVAVVMHQKPEKSPIENLHKHLNPDVLKAMGENVIKLMF